MLLYSNNDMFLAFHVGDMSIDPAETLIVAIKVWLQGVPGLITTDGLEAYVERLNVYFGSTTSKKEKLY